MSHSCSQELYETTTDRVVVVSNYTTVLDALENLLGKREWTTMRLDGSIISGKRQVWSIASTDAELLYAAPSHLMCIINGS
jgi:Iap family predicted aminopeptidase